MTSACILKDTLRNDNQVLLKFRDSFFEICVHLMNSNCTSYFLPSLMLSSGAGTTKKIPLNSSEVSLPAIPITLSFSFFQFSWSIKTFSWWRLLNWTWYLTLQWIRWILMCFLWNKSPMSPMGLVHKGTTLRICRNPQRCRRITQQGCPQLPRSQPPNLKSLLLTTTLTNQQCHTDSDVISRSFHRAWTIWTCRPIYLTSWQQGPW